MSNKNIYKVFFSIYLFAFSQSNASLIEVEEPKLETHVTPLNHQSKQLMEDMLSLNQLYQKLEEAEKVAPQSYIISSIKEHTEKYIIDLKKITPQILSSTDFNLEDQELMNQVHRNNNPLESFYY